MSDKQVAIAAYTGRSQPAVAQMVVVGGRADKFIATSNNPLHLPEGWRSLYALSDLTKTQIKTLCKDKAPTQKRIKEYKVELGIAEPAKPRKKAVAPAPVTVENKEWSSPAVTA